jgi:hypothetical protein
MSQVMINEMRKFPNDISIYKPPPGKRRLKNSVPFKEPDAENHYRKREKVSDETIQHIRKKRNLIFYEPEFSLQNTFDDFNKQKQRKKRRNDGNDSFLR